MEPIQIVAIIFALFSLFKLYIKNRQGEVSVNELVLWGFVWLALIFVALNPSVIGFLARVFGVTRTIDFVVYVSIIVIFYLIFRIFVRLHNLQQDTTRIVREIAKEKDK